MKLQVGVEINSIHDAVMLDTLIDLYKAKWKADEAEVENDDAEDEQNDDADEESEDGYECYFPETKEEKAHRKALDKLADCLRKSGVADVSFTFCGNEHRRKNRS